MFTTKGLGTSWVDEIDIRKYLPPPIWTPPKEPVTLAPVVAAADAWTAEAAENSRKRALWLGGALAAGVLAWVVFGGRK